MFLARYEILRHRAEPEGWSHLFPLFCQAQGEFESPPLTMKTLCRNHLTIEPSFSSDFSQIHFFYYRALSTFYKKKIIIQFFSGYFFVLLLFFSLCFPLRGKQWEKIWMKKVQKNGKPSPPSFLRKLRGSFYRWLCWFNDKPQIFLYSLLWSSFLKLQR